MHEELYITVHINYAQKNREWPGWTSKELYYCTPTKEDVNHRRYKLQPLPPDTCSSSNYMHISSKYWNITDLYMSQ